MHAFGATEGGSVRVLPIRRAGRTIKLWGQIDLISTASLFERSAWSTGHFDSPVSCATLWIVGHGRHGVVPLLSNWCMFYIILIRPLSLLIYSTAYTPSSHELVNQQFSIGRALNSSLVSQSQFAPFSYQHWKKLFSLTVYPTEKQVKKLHYHSDNASLGSLLASSHLHVKST